MSKTAEILPGLVAHASGAIWIPATKTMLIADAHLGYSWAQRRRGELGPIADFQAKEKLLAACAEWNSERIVFLGDLVHAPKPCEPERAWIEDTLNLLAQSAQLIAVRGNHDRAFAKEFSHLPVQMLEAWQEDRILAVHGDRLKGNEAAADGVLIFGHLHPCLAVAEASGATRNLPIFLVNQRCVLMPAFSPFARGYDVRCGFPDAIGRCFQEGETDVYAATPNRIAHLGPLSRAVEQISQSGGLPAASFRGHARRTAVR